MARTARLIAFLALFCSTLLLAAPLAAQPASPRSTVSGTASDTSHGALPGVSVTLTSASGAEVARTVTGLDGRFTVSTTEPGQYLLEATLSGFRIHTADARQHLHDAKRTLLGPAVPLRRGLSGEQPQHARQLVVPGGRRAARRRSTLGA